jgi:hypothetical protein
MTDLTPITGGQAIAVPDTQRNARTALGLWLASYRSENTRHAYRSLRRFPPARRM